LPVYQRERAMLNPRDRQTPIAASIDDDDDDRLPAPVALAVIGSLSLASWAAVIAVCEAFAAVLT
jgi:hypothetical protein